MKRTNEEHEEHRRMKENEEHRRKGKLAKTKAQREQECGVRYTELIRLPALV